MTKKYEVEVQQVDEYFIELPPDLLEKVEWTIGDDIKFEIQDDGSIHLKKVQLDNVELNFDDEELFKYMQRAHELGISFNQFCENALEDVIKKRDFENECG